MTFDDARHLLSRAGFGGSPDEIRACMKQDRLTAVRSLLENRASRAKTVAPSWIDRLPPPPRARKHMGEAERKAFREERKQEGLELKQWWYRELVSTSSPLLERMTLFWHNHFTSSLHKVHWPPFLYHQNVLLRTHALGSFRDLLSAIARNPAMILYLDTQSNHKDRPNENFARELFELFTLGEGHYTERDIKEAARSFTGWHVDHHNGTFRINRREHDEGTKVIFGMSGHLEGDDVLNLTLEQPNAAPFIVRKLWREFISDQPDEREIDRLATTFRQSRYHLRPLLTELLLSDAFWSSENRGLLFKSPVELIVGTIRLFHLPIEEPMQLVRYGRRLGQDLFDPPNVKGWAGGTRWITTSTLLDRWQLVQRVVRGHEMGHQSGDQTMHYRPAAGWVEQEPWDVVRVTLLPISPVREIPAADERWQSIRQLMLDPAYQLK